MKLRCVLLDDQTMFLQMLVAMIRNVPGLEVIGSFERVTPALDFCQRNETDLLIIDLQLPDGLGFRFFKQRFGRIEK